MCTSWSGCGFSSWIAANECACRVCSKCLLLNFLGNWQTVFHGARLISRPVLTCERTVSQPRWRLLSPSLILALLMCYVLRLWDCSWAALPGFMGEYSVKNLFRSSDHVWMGLSYIWVLRAVHVSWIQVLCPICALQNVFPVCGLLFISLMTSFKGQMFSVLIKSRFIYCF